MLVEDGLVRFLPAWAEIPMWSEARVCKCLVVSTTYKAPQL